MLAINPFKGGFGAEVSGIDVAAPLDDEACAAVCRELLDHIVLVIPAQSLTARQLAAFCARFGPITRHILDQYHHPETGEICIISNVADGGAGRTTAKPAGSYWHADLSYLPEPAEATFLYALEVPAEGGDTLFADMYRAYETLPEATKARIAGLNATHHIFGGRGDDAKVVLDEAQRAKTPEVIHPVVRRHPETGRTVLFVNPGFTRRIVELDEDESAAVLAELFAHATQPAFHYRHIWRPGQIVACDNRASIHTATGGYTAAARRTLWRSFVGGRYAA